MLAKDKRILGVGAGQMNRVESGQIAIRHAGDEAKGSAMASDAFFPFPDNVEQAAEAGIAAIVQPGGSKKDDDVIAAADKHGIAMVFTGKRHFTCTDRALCERSIGPFSCASRSICLRGPTSGCSTIAPSAKACRQSRGESPQTPEPLRAVSGHRSRHRNHLSVTMMLSRHRA